VIRSVSIRNRGRVIRYRLSEPARVVITIKPRKGRATRLSKRSGKGANTARRRHALKPGRYTLTLVATDAANNRSKPKRLTFRVRR
jgi:hypothetical protein